MPGGVVGISFLHVTGCFGLVKKANDSLDVRTRFARTVLNLPPLAYARPVPT